MGKAQCWNNNRMSQFWRRNNVLKCWWEPFLTHHLGLPLWRKVFRLRLILFHSFSNELWELLGRSFVVLWLPEWVLYLTEYVIGQMRMLDNINSSLSSPEPSATQKGRYIYLEALLQGGAPWGFALQGGLEHGQPLIISKVFFLFLMKCTQVRRGAQFKGQETLKCCILHCVGLGFENCWASFEVSMLAQELPIWATRELSALSNYQRASFVPQEVSWLAEIGSIYLTAVNGGSKGLSGGDLVSWSHNVSERVQ